MSQLREVTTCRVCRSDALHKYLDLGMQPLANAYRIDRDAGNPVFPLAIQACLRCKLSQLTHVVPPEWMYTDYAYQSGVSAGWREHCRQLVNQYAKPEAVVVDIASNDGTLVRTFSTWGCHAVGVEPSQSFARADYPKYIEWWTRAFAEREFAKDVDIITAQNVLGHVDDVHDFMEGIKLALAPEGIAIIEVPYVVDMLTNVEFDTIYHEHLSYWSVTALKELVDAHGLVLRHVEQLDLHGGSIRAIIAKSGTHSMTVVNALFDEAVNLNVDAYDAFTYATQKSLTESATYLSEIGPYAGYGAAAKTTVLLNALDPSVHPMFVYDDNSAKWGKYIPGTNVKIVEPPEDWSDVRLPRQIVVFAWNWLEGISTRLWDVGYTGGIVTLKDLYV